MGFVVIRFTGHKISINSKKTGCRAKQSEIGGRVGLNVDHSWRYHRLQVRFGGACRCMRVWVR